LLPYWPYGPTKITPHKAINNTTPHLDDEITKIYKRKNLIYVETTYLDSKKGKKKDADESFHVKKNT